MQLLLIHTLGDAGLPMKTKTLSRQRPIREIGVIKGFDRLDPAHPARHGLQVAPDGPDAFRRGLNLSGD
jgi:hypothetical protein